MFSDLSFRDYVFEVLEKEHIKTIVTSNIGSEVLEKIGKLFCFSDDFFDANTFSRLDELLKIRNHIAHGYFDIDGDIVLDVIKNNLDELLAAINYFITKFSI